MVRTIWIVSRHPGAQHLLADLGFVGLRRSHLDIEDVNAGDLVVGTLPVCLIARLCSRGIEYWHLSMNLEVSDRGQELSVDRMKELDVRIERFNVQCVASHDIM